MINPSHLRVMLPASIVIAWSVRWLGIPLGQIDAFEFWCWPVLSLQSQFGPWIWPLNAAIWVISGFALCAAEVYKRTRGRKTGVALIQSGALVMSLVFASFCDRFGEYIGP
jgi:hypothetical protein